MDEMLIFDPEGKTWIGSMETMMCSRMLSVYLTSPLSIKIASFYPALLNQPQNIKMSCLGFAPKETTVHIRPPNARILQRKLSKAKGNRIATARSSPVLIQRVCKSRLSRINPTSVRTTIMKHSCPHSITSTLAVPAKAEGNVYCL